MLPRKGQLIFRARNLKVTAQLVVVSLGFHGSFPTRRFYFPSTSRRRSCGRAKKVLLLIPRIFLAATREFMIASSVASTAAASKEFKSSFFKMDQSTPPSV